MKKGFTNQLRAEKFIYCPFCEENKTHYFNGSYSWICTYCGHCNEQEFPDQSTLEAGTTFNAPEPMETKKELPLKTDCGNGLNNTCDCNDGFCHYSEWGSADAPAFPERKTAEEFEIALKAEIEKLPFTSGLDDGGYNAGQIDGFESGATWAYEISKAKDKRIAELEEENDLMKKEIEYLKRRSNNPF